jgi:hypothetical protein
LTTPQQEEEVAAQCLLPCPHNDAIEGLKAMHADIKAMRDIIEAWNTAKGFVVMMQLAGTLLKWVFTVGLAVTALMYFLKTGSWTGK